MRATLQLAGWLLVIGVYFAMDLAHRSEPPPVDDDMVAMVGVVERPLVAVLGEDALVGGLGCLVSFGLWAAYRRLPRPRSGLALAAGALVGTIAGAWLWHALLDLAHWMLRGPPPAGGVEFGVDAGPGSVLMSFFILAAWHAVAIALEHMQRAEEARVEALRYQLNPHFLFNALNSAIALVGEAPERAQALLTRLSSLLRETLREQRVTLLADELELALRYLEIERVRHEDKLVFELSCDEAARACRVPPLIVHTLVENAVKHGFRTGMPPVRVRLECRLDGEHLRLRCSQNGRLEPGEGVGLRNLQARLAALYPRRHRFRLEERDGQVHASVDIRRPERAP
jgi:Histidine kinase